MRATIAFIGVTILLAPAAVDAQQAPSRPTRLYRGLFGGGPPTDPNRVRHELTMTTTVQGGYDDLITPQGLGGLSDPGAPMQSGFATFLTGSMRYWYGRTGRSLTAEGVASSNLYSGIDVSSLTGYSGRFHGETDLGRRSRFDATQEFRYEPSLVFGAYSTLQSAVDSNLLPETGVGSGFAEQRSWATTTTMNVERQWSSRHRTSAAFDYLKRDYLDELGFDSNTTNLTARHDWSVTRAVRIQGAYTYSDSTLFGAAGLTTPITDQNFNGGVSYSRRLSATRQILIAGGVGAIRVTTLNSADRSPLEYWTQSGYGTFRLDFKRTWNVTTDYRRGVTVLQGISPESFTSNAGRVGLDGSLSRRIDVTFSGSFSDGVSTGVAQISRFQTYNIMAQMRYALSRCCAAIVNYDYYFYHLRSVVTSPRFPTEYDRNSIRLGLTVWLPLYGTSSDGATPRQPARSR